MGRTLHCGLCDNKIEKWGSEEFQYGPDNTGDPYCDQCWPTLKLIFDLQERVKELEVKEQQRRGEAQRQENIRQATRGN